VAGIAVGAILALVIASNNGVSAILPVAVCQILAVIGIAILLMRMKGVHDNVAMAILGSTTEPADKQRAESLVKLAEQFALQYASIVERERLIADFSPHVVCLLDRKMNIKCINPACAKLWGYIPAQLVDSNICTFLAGNDVGFKNACEEAFTSGEERQVTVKFKNSDEQIVDLRWTLEWSARHGHFFAIAEDVTIEMRTERIKNEFLALIAHDLRSPIAAMDASLQLLEAGINPYGDPKDQYRKMRERTDYLLRLLNDILEMNRIEESQIHIEREETSLKDLCTEAADLVQELANQKQIKCEVMTDEAQILVDKHRIKRVIVNLLVNAIKFSPENSTVTIRATTERQSDVVIAVVDQGRGISEADKARIFSKFEQVESSDSSIKGGAGLGLAICRTLVNAHGGTISVQSQIGKGSTFTIVLKDALAGVATSV
jgi:PAS domain S-box-containing protein